jgi:S-adenosylmethionine-diacylglycerol 3-amino-3-carboxypropyl transferase
MAAPYGFGLSQEDELTEARALRLERGDRVLCIASAGEMPLSLLAMGAGAVTAVDIDPRQLHLLALKLGAIVALERGDALAFLGFLPAPPARRREWLEAVLPELAAAPRQFWHEHPRVVEQGAIWQGRYERYLRLLFALARPVLPRRSLEALFAQPTLEAQRAHFERAIGGRALRAVFRVAFDPRVFARGGMDPRSLRFRRSPLPLGEQYFARFRAFCTDHPARENPFLQLTLLGRLLGPDAAPTCLSAAGFAAVRARRAALAPRHEEVRACLEREPPGSFEKVHLSNLADWLSAPEFEALLRTLSRRIARPGRAVWRWLHVARAVPNDLRGALRAEPELGEQLAASDRFPFYGVMPVAAPAEAAT